MFEIVIDPRGQGRMGMMGSYINFVGEPPKEETAEEKEKRLADEAEAKRKAEEETESGPSNIGTVIEVRNGRDVYLAAGGSIMHIKKKKSREIFAGDTVALDPESGRLIGVADSPVVFSGKICFVKKVFDDVCEVSMDGTTVLVSTGRAIPRPGDKVVLDATGSVIVKNLGAPGGDYAPTKIPSVTWDDIGGQHEAKKVMIEAIEHPHTQKELFQFYGKKQCRGILLFGPPGCGKTMLGKAAANSLARLYGGEANESSFIYLKGPEVLDKYVGASEASVRALFTQAKAHKEKHGYPAVIFIDEAESLLTARGEGSSTLIGQTIVPTFLAEMDGLEESSALVILATNRQDQLDPAITRDGRIDRKVRVTRPDQKSASDILRMNLMRAPVADGEDIDQMIEAAVLAIFSSKRILKTVQVKGHERILEIKLANIVNGALLAGIVDQAMSLAIQRDIETSDPSGLKLEDLLFAVDSIEQQNRELNFNGVIQEMMGA